MAVTTSIVKKSLGNAASMGIPLFFGVQEFQSSREQGRGVVESGLRAGADFMLGEAMGSKYLLFNLAMAAPPLAVSAYQTIDQMSRYNNSDNRNKPFANARFQDSKPAYTMRQAGMELAKASRYNLEQSLMGNEASYFKI